MPSSSLGPSTAGNFEFGVSPKTSTKAAAVPRAGPKSGSSSPFYKSKEWQAVRARVLRRDGYRCVVCQADLRPKGMSRVDHILSIRSRPELALVMTNLRSLCPSCDNSRHAGRGTGADDRPMLANDGLPDSWR